MQYALSLAKTTRWVGTVTVNVEAGRLRHNRRFSFGPSVTLEIPLFDQRQAQIAKLEAHVRQGEAELRELAIDVRADVRSSRARVTTARSVALDYAKVVVPQRENVVRSRRSSTTRCCSASISSSRPSRPNTMRTAKYIEAVRD